MSGLFHTGAYAAHDADARTLLQMFVPNNRLPPGLRMSNRALRAWIDDVAKSTCSPGVPLMLAVEDEDTYDVEINDALVMQYLGSLSAPDLQTVLDQIQAAFPGALVSAAPALTSPLSVPSRAPTPISPLLLAPTSGTSSDLPESVFEYLQKRHLEMFNGNQLQFTKLTDHLRPKRLQIDFSISDVMSKVVVDDDGKYMTLQLIDVTAKTLNVDVLRQALTAEASINPDSAINTVSAFDTFYNSVFQMITANRPNLGLNAKPITNWNDALDPATKTSLMIDHLNKYLGEVEQFANAAFQALKRIHNAPPDGVAFYLVDILQRTVQLCSDYDVLAHFYVVIAPLLDMLPADAANPRPQDTADPYYLIKFNVYLARKAQNMNSMKVWAGYQFALQILNRDYNIVAPPNAEFAAEYAKYTEYIATWRHFQWLTTQVPGFATKPENEEGLMMVKKQITAQYLHAVLPLYVSINVSDVDDVVKVYNAHKAMKPTAVTEAQQLTQQLAEMQKACTDKITQTQQEWSGRFAALESRYKDLEKRYNEMQTTDMGQVTAQLEAARNALAQRSLQVDTTQESLKQAGNLLNQFQERDDAAILTKTIDTKPATLQDVRYKAAVLHTYPKTPQIEEELRKLRSEAEAMLSAAVSEAKTAVAAFVQVRPLGSIGAYDPNQMQKLANALNAVVEASNYYLVIMDDILQTFDRKMNAYPDFKQVLDSISRAVTRNNYDYIPNRQDPLKAMQYLWSEAQSITRAEAARAEAAIVEAARAEAARAEAARAEAAKLDEIRSMETRAETVLNHTMIMLSNAATLPTQLSQAIELKRIAGELSATTQTFRNYASTYDANDRRLERLRNLVSELDMMVRTNDSYLSNILQAIQNTNYKDLNYDSLVQYAQAASLLFPNDVGYVSAVFQTLLTKFKEHLETCARQEIRPRNDCLKQAREMILRLQNADRNAMIVKEMKVSFLGLQTKHVEEFKKSVQGFDDANELEYISKYFEEHPVRTSKASPDEIVKVLWPEKASNSDLYNELVAWRNTNDLPPENAARLHGFVTRFLDCNEPNKLLECLGNERTAIVSAIEIVEKQHASMIERMKGPFTDPDVESFLSELDALMPNTSDQAKYVQTYLPDLSAYLEAGELREEQQYVAAMALVMKLRKASEARDIDKIKRLELQLKDTTKDKPQLLKDARTFLNQYRFGDLIAGATTYESAKKNIKAIRAQYKSVADSDTLRILFYFNDLSNGSEYVEHLSEAERDVVITELLRVDGATFAKLIGEDVNDPKFNDRAARILPMCVFLGMDPVAWLKSQVDPPLPASIESATSIGDELMNAYLQIKYKDKIEFLLSEPLDVKAVVLLDNVLKTSDPAERVKLRAILKGARRDTLDFLHQRLFNKPTQLEEEDAKVADLLVYGSFLGLFKNRINTDEKAFEVFRLLAKLYNKDTESESLLEACKSSDDLKNAIAGIDFTVSYEQATRSVQDFDRFVAEHEDAIDAIRRITYKRAAPNVDSAVAEYNKLEQDVKNVYGTIRDALKISNREQLRQTVLNGHELIAPSFESITTCSAPDNIDMIEDMVRCLLNHRVAVLNVLEKAELSGASVLKVSDPTGEKSSGTDDDRRKRRFIRQEPQEMVPNPLLTPERTLDKFTFTVLANQPDYEQIIKGATQKQFDEFLSKSKMDELPQFKTEESERKTELINTMSAYILELSRE